jgi:hypothetical protein
MEAFAQRFVSVSESSHHESSSGEREENAVSLFTGRGEREATRLLRETGGRGPKTQRAICRSMLWCCVVQEATGWL